MPIPGDSTSSTSSNGGPKRRRKSGFVSPPFRSRILRLEWLEEIAAPVDMFNTGMPAAMSMPAPAIASTNTTLIQIVPPTSTTQSSPTQTPVSSSPAVTPTASTPTTVALPASPTSSNVSLADHVFGNPFAVAGLNDPFTTPSNPPPSSTTAPQSTNSNPSAGQGGTTAGGGSANVGAGGTTTPPAPAAPPLVTPVVPPPVTPPSAPVVGPTSTVTPAPIPASAVPLIGLSDRVNAPSDKVVINASQPGTGWTYSAMGLPAGVTLDPVRGWIHGQIAASAVAATPYSVTVNAVNASGSAITKRFNWTVDAVTLNAPADQANVIGDTVSLHLGATDAAGVALLYTADGLPPGVVLNRKTGDLSGTITADANTTNAYEVTITAGHDGVSATQSFLWEVTAPISLVSPDDQRSITGDAVTLPVKAMSARGLPLQYSATGLPANLTINPQTGVISGKLNPQVSAPNLSDPSNPSALAMPTFTGTATSTYAVTVSASDGTNSSSVSFAWSIDPAIRIEPIVSPSSSVGDLMEIPVTAGSAKELTLAYSATGLPSGVSIDPATGDIKGTIAVTPQAAGPHIVNVTVTDGTNSLTQAFYWYVSPVGLVRPNDFASPEGSAASLQLVGLNATTVPVPPTMPTLMGGMPATLPAPTQMPIWYTAVGLPPGMVLNSATGLITGAPLAGTQGDWPVTVSASDGIHGETQSFVWTVQAPLPASATTSPTATPTGGITMMMPNGQTMTYYPVTVPVVAPVDPMAGMLTRMAADVVSLGSVANQVNTIGDTVSLPLLSTDSLGGTVSVSADGLPEGLGIDPSGRIFGTISPTAETDTPYQVTLTASSVFTSVSVTFQWTVHNSVTLAAIAGQSGLQGNAVSLAVSATTQQGRPLTYSAVGLPGNLVMDPATGRITGTLPVDGAGDYAIEVTASDGLSSDVQDFTWTINPAVTLAAIPAQNNLSGDAVTLSLAGSLARGGSPTYSADGLPPGLVLSPSGILMGTIAPGAAQHQPYEVTVTATDGVSTASQTLAWQVRPGVTLNAPADRTDALGSTVSFSLSGSSVRGNALSYTAVGLPSGVTMDSQGRIRGTIGLDAQTDSPYQVTFTISDGRSSATRTFAWQISPSLSLAAPADQQSAAGDTVSLPLTATSAWSPNLRYSADGLPPGLSFDSQGRIVGMIAPDAAAMDYAVTVWVENDGDSASVSFTWTVGNARSLASPGDQTNNVGDTVDLSLMAMAPAGSVLAWSATGLPSGLVMNRATGKITGTIASSAGMNRPYAVSISVSDGQVTLSQSFNWTVASTDPTIAPNNGRPGTSTPPRPATPASQPTAGTPTTGSTTTPTTSTTGPKSPAPFLLSSGPSVQPATPSGTSGSTSSIVVIGGSVSSASDGLIQQSRVLSGLRVSVPMLVNENWNNLLSPFYASSRDAAKYRAWTNAPVGTTSATAVGAEVASQFGVPATQSWGQFFPMSEYQALKAERAATAARLAPRLLGALDAEWRTAMRRNSGPIGAAVAARWLGVAGFGWVRAATGWEEFYTQEAYAAFQVFRAKRPPTISLADPNLNALNTNASPVQLAVYLASVRIGGKVAYRWYGSSLYTTQVGGKSVSDYLEGELRDKVLPALLPLSMTDIASYISTLSPRDKLALRLALSAEMARLEGLVSSDVQQQADNLAMLLLSKRMYSQLGYDQPGASYGAQASNITGIGSYLTRRTNNTAPILLSFGNANTGTLAQRLAFLADTSYAVFRAREMASIEGQYPGAEQPALKAAAIAAIPTATGYYTARDLLSAAIRYAVANNQSPTTAMAGLMNPWLVQPRLIRTSRVGPNGVGLLGETFTLTGGVPTPNLTANKYVYDRYLAGMSGDRGLYFTQDRYSEENLGASLLATWQNADTTTQQSFADNLPTLDRSALVNSLNRYSAQLANAGLTARAQEAQDAAKMITDRFDTDYNKLASDARLKAAFDAAKQLPSALTGLPAQYQADYDRLPSSLKLMAQETRDGLHSVYVKRLKLEYQAGLGHTYIDRTVLYASMILSPVYRTWVRLKGGLGYSGMDDMSDLDVMQQIISGDYSGTLGPRMVDMSWGGQTYDMAMTLLTIVPLASGARGLTAGAQGLLQVGVQQTTTAELMYFATNRALMGGLSVATSAAGMAAADSIPGLSDGQRSALRLTLGLAGGVAPGIAAVYGPAMMRSATIRLTRGVVLLRTRIAALKDQIKALTAGAAKEALKTEQALTERAVAAVQQRIDEIWAKGGRALADAGTENKSAAAEVRKLVEKANTPGISPAEQAALLTGRELKDAQQALAASERKLLEEFEKAERKWWEASPTHRAAGGASPILRRAGSTSDYSSQSGTGSFRPLIDPHGTLDALPAEGSTVQALLQGNYAAPGAAGVTLNQQSIRFADIWALTEKYGVEFGLTHEVSSTGGRVFRLYSGTRGSVTYPNMVTNPTTPGPVLRRIGHTHPSGNRYPSFPSPTRAASDITTINNIFLDMIMQDPSARLPHSRVIWGPGPYDNTIYYPTILR